VRDVVAVNEPHGLVGVEARHQDACAAGVHVSHGHAEGGDVEQREREQVVIRRGQAEASHGGHVGRDDIGVGQHRAAGNHVHRGRGDDGERIGGRHIGAGASAGRSVERVKGLEAGRG
jgi:hypothetical protein